MNHIYHFVPEHMQGTVLFPLNEIREKYPDSYAKEVEKYAGRELVTETRIPQLDCIWNDVLFFSTVHPKKLKDFLNSFGYGYKVNWTFYEIPVSDLDASKLLIYKDKGRNIQGSLPDEDCVAYDEKTFSEYSELADSNKEYLTRILQGPGQRFNMFAGAVHALYKGSVDVSKYKSITL